MSEIYSPWSNVGAEYGVEDNMATAKYEEGYDEAEDAGEMPEAESEDGGEAEGSGHMSMMAEAMSIINDQQIMIKSLTAQLTGKTPGTSSE